MKHLICVCLLLLNYSLEAGMRQDMERFFAKAGTLSNVTGGRAVQLQSSGHYAGGSINARNSVRNLPKPLHIAPPQLRAGCGGIDVYFGSFSHISGKELEQFFKATATNAVGYTAMLGLEATMPMVAGVQKSIKQVTDIANLRNTNSCALATQAGEYGRRILSGQNACAQRSNLGRSDDFEALQQKCVNSSKERKKSEEENQIDTAIGNKNIVWLAIEKSPAFHGSEGFDRDLAEFAMSLIGTVVITESKIKGDKKDSPTFESKHYPSKLNEEFLKAFFAGNKGLDVNGEQVKTNASKRYRCDKVEGCMVVKEVDAIVEVENSWRGRVQTLIKKIQTKIQEGNSEFLPNEDALIQKSYVPISKALNVISAMREFERIPPFNEEILGEVISFDLFMSYLGEVVEDVRASIKALQKHQSDDSVLKDFLKEVDRVLVKIAAHRKDFNQSVLRNQKFMNELEHYENAIWAQSFF